MGIIATFFSIGFCGCSQKADVKLVSAKGHTIDAKIKELPSRRFDYLVLKAGQSVTVKVDSAVVSLRDARWFKAKSNRCEKNGRKYKVALRACNEQIVVMGDLHEKQ